MTDESGAPSGEQPAATGDNAVPEAVRRVASLLAAAGVEARLHEFPAGTPTAAAAAKAVGCAVDQIVKSLIFVCDGEAALVMVSGSGRADDAKIAEAVGASTVRIAKPDVVRDRTGFEVGGVAPFPLPRVGKALCDRRLLGHEVVWAGAGSDRHMVALAPHDLVKLANARAADISIPMAGSDR